MPLFSVEEEDTCCVTGRDIDGFKSNTEEVKRVYLRGKWCH